MFGRPGVLCFVYFSGITFPQKVLLVCVIKSGREEKARKKPDATDAKSRAKSRPIAELTSPTEHFTILEPPNPPLNVFGQSKN